MFTKQFQCKKIKKQSFMSKLFFVILVFFLFIIWKKVSAVEIGSIIYDTETQEFLEELARPLWRAAGLPKEQVKLYIVYDPSVNAFVTDGRHMFVNTGLINYATNPEEIAGVIAHETGHITDAHMMRARNAAIDNVIPLVISMLLGAAAMTTGAGDIGTGIIAAGAQIANRNALTYSRTQEASADQAGISYLEKAHMSGQGMLELFQKLAKTEQELGPDLNPFALDHPLSYKRLELLKKRIKKSPYYANKLPKSFTYRLRLIQAKFHGIFDAGCTILFDHYKKDDNSDKSLYAHSYFYYRTIETKKALETINILLDRYPDNPYFLQTKAQILFQANKMYKSILTYEKALRQKPNTKEFMIDLVRAMISINSDEYTKKALKWINKAVIYDPHDPFLFYQMSVVYGRMHNIGMAEYATAQRFYFFGDYKSAKLHARRAIKLLPNGSSYWLKSQDILIHNKN